MSVPLLALLRTPSLWVVLGLAYAGAGAGLAWQLGRVGYGLGTSSMALLCWPLLLGLARRPPPTQSLEHLVGSRERPASPGPNAARIDACVASLARTALDADADADAGLACSLLDSAQLHKLASELHRADHRIARVDRLLGEAQSEELRGADLRPDGPLLAAVAELSTARSAAQAELEAVLSGLLSLRVQLGMFTLAGEVEPVRERLAELEARVSALAELSSIELAQVGS